MLEGWKDFFVAEAGASAALLGLVFVSISINLSKILASAFLPNRCLLAMLLLLAILVVASLMLIPDQPRWAFAADIAAVGLPTWVTVTSIEIAAFRQSGENISKTVRIGKLVVLEVATLSYLLAAGLLASGVAGALNWLAAAIILSIVRAAFDAWVLLVEINR